MSSLDKLTIRGFKSIKELDSFELKNLNVSIGANGAGKSNLISFFQMLRSLILGNLKDWLRNNGGASDLLFHVIKHRLASPVTPFPLRLFSSTEKIAFPDQ